jgi:periplasmic divalent cation tolerance protein
METKEHIVVFVTAKDNAEARVIAQGLLQEKLIACANIVDGVQSLFWWQGKIDEGREVLVILKTRRDLFDRVASKVKELHSYDTPEIIALPIVQGNSNYLDWINSSVSS